MNINEFHPTSGRFVKEDGATVNIADELGGKSVSDKVYDIDNMMPHSGRFIKEDGTCVNIADMIANGDIGGGGGSSGGGSSDDSAPPIVETYNGQVIQCSMSADRPIKGLNLYATCEQQTYSGKNLFNKDTIENGIVNASGQLDSSETVKTSDFIKVKPSTQYKSSFAAAYVKFYTSEKEPVQTESVDIKANTQSFTTGESTEYIRYSFNFTSQTPETLIIVEGTNELTPYEPYVGGIPSPNVDYPQEIQTTSDFVVEVKNSMGEGATPQTLNITIPEQGFYGIPVESGGNYTDSSGQQWVCDEFDFERGVYVRRIGIETINGGYNFFETLDVPGRFRENRAGFTNLYKNGDYESICNIALWTRWAISRDATVWRFALSGDTYYLRPPVSSGINNATELNAFLNDLGVRLVLVGQLESPIEYNLTDAEIEQYKKLRSYYGTTHIDNNAVPACNMQAELVLDTKLYIDNKFTTLAGQILEMEEEILKNSNKINDIVNMLGMVDSWKVVQRLIKEGYGAEVFPIGTQLRCSHSVYGEIIWDVVAHDYNLEESEHSMTLLSHDCIVNSIQYDAAEALYYAETQLAAGTYYFSLLSGYDTNYGGGKNIQFTLTKPVPAGGVIMFPWAYNTQSTATKISTYSSRESTSALETVAVIEGTSGTNLGTTDGKTANMNHIHRVRYGSNNWKESAIRQFLNSNVEAGSVWTPQTKFDRPPSWAASTDGFMKGFDDDFLSVVGECNHLTKTNSVFEVDGNLNKLYTTKDRFYLASHSEIFGGSENNLADGTQFPYYNEATNTDRIKYNAETARHWWLRSPNPSHASNVRGVRTDGSLSYSGASNSSGVAVACDIC